MSSMRIFADFAGIFLLLSVLVSVGAADAELGPESQPAVTLNCSILKEDMLRNGPPFIMACWLADLGQISPRTNYSLSHYQLRMAGKKLDTHNVVGDCKLVPVPTTTTTTTTTTTRNTTILNSTAAVPAPALDKSCKCLCCAECPTRTQDRDLIGTSNKDARPEGRVVDQPTAGQEDPKKTNRPPASSTTASVTSDTLPVSPPPKYVAVVPPKYVVVVSNQTLPVGNATGRTAELHDATMRQDCFTVVVVVSVLCGVFAFIALVACLVCLVLRRRAASKF